MSELPSGWGRAEIGDLCNLINGRAFKPQEWSDSGLPIIRIQNLNNPASKFNHFSGDFDAKHHVKNGDLLFAWSGTPGTSFGAHIWHGGDAVLNQHIFKIEFSERETNRGFLRYAINQKLDELISSAQGGVGLRHVTKGTFEKTEISFPPLAEQTRITQKLDELLAQVDTLKARIDAIPVLLKRFRRSVLAAAVSGRLTEEWRAQNSSAEWQTITVGELCKLKSGIAVSGDIEKAKGDFKYFKVGEMNLEGNEFFLQKTDRYLARDDAPEKSLMPAGAIVFPKRGGAIATNKKRILKDASFVDLNVMGIIAPEGVETLYIYRWFETVDLAKLNTGSTIPQVNNTDIAPLIIPLPPLAEQTEIVRRVEQLFAFADQLEAKVASAKSRIDHLTQSILAKAFRGELVPQDPNDEPASVLLERIQAQRAAAPKAKRGRKASA
ncbi:restriction endonuclease subunit S [Stutzerimonas kunmingensis]|uniref:restriction endonuclease subunit S n=1 Tax=Stutzerimonas kunmingensis TaxID=1211807 RepID=UPI00241FF738|nr:restriction endonuclease subunit S [Stutzerimonas kunmingensis]